MKTGRYSLYQLFSNPEIEQIIIPEIQRDYVWKQENVVALLDSIFQRYESKSDIRLDISWGGNSISANVTEFLSNEYSKLLHSTKIGFIYAYHDPNYPGKFFLIDGQQRITTLYLLMIALYKRQVERWAEFRETYMSCGLPKVDYRVREVTHDFMVGLLENEFSRNTISFEQSCHYYASLYDYDQTTRTMKSNYAIIADYVAAKLTTNEALRSFTDYIEYFVEFNFFDTNISAQGERLYLYMNSRGENLSFQETIKSIIIKSCKKEEKNDMGKEWEDWQDYFWIHRGKNSNADLGMQKFLKWTVALHICSNPENKISLKQPRESSNGKLQTNMEVIEDYIKDPSVAPSQERDIQIYIKNNTISLVWLRDFMSAVKRLEKERENNPELQFAIDPDWLSAKDKVIDYISLLPCLRYLMRFPNSDLDSLVRVAMFLKNKSYDTTHKKNPDRATILAIRMINEIPEEFMDISSVQGNTLFSEIDREIMRKINSQDHNRDYWDKVLYDFVKSEWTHHFFAGDMSAIWYCSSTHIDFSVYQQKFYEKIYLHKDENSLRRELLKYGDYSQYDGGGSANLSEWMGRYNWISTDDDWRKILKEERFILSHIKPMLDETPSIVSLPVWIQYFAEEQLHLFMGARRFLYKEDDLSPRIILIDGVQAGEYSSREMEIRMLDKICSFAYHWVYNYRTLVIPFAIKDNKIESCQDNISGSNYFIDVVFNWSPKCSGTWYIYIGKRDFNKFATQIDEFDKPLEYKYGRFLYQNDSSLSLRENVDKVVKALQQLLGHQLVDVVSRMFQQS